MKKRFETPKVEVINVDMNDVISTSCNPDYMGECDTNTYCAED